MDIKDEARFIIIFLGGAAALFVCSLIGWQFPTFGTAAAFLFGLFVAVIAFKSPTYAIAIVIAELAMGGFGSWLTFDLGGIQLSVRMVFFLALMGGWGVREVLRHRGAEALSSEVKKLMYHLRPHSPAFSLVVLCSTVMWGMAWGFLRGNSFEAVLLDANGWWYWALLLPLLAEIKEKKRLVVLVCAVLGASLAASLLTVVIYIIFINNHGIAPDLYRWMRDTRLGELTPLFPHGWRVFMQSQVWALMAAGWGMAMLFCQHVRRKKISSFIAPYAVIILSLTALLLSLSRSYWIGLAVLCSVLFILFCTIYRKSVLPVFAHAIGAFLISVTIIYGIQYIALRGESGYSLAQRMNIHEPAGTSRMNQLRPLIRAIAQHPIIGSGFGTTVTYKSLDPRIVSSTAGKTGVYTTYAFEWGYLDIWLKIGLMGLVAYVWLIGGIVRGLWTELCETTSSQSPDVIPASYPGTGQAPAGYQTEKENKKRYSWFLFSGSPIAVGDDSERRVIVITSLCSLAALAFVNVTSPYLNHPLGIGMVLLSCVYALRFGPHSNP